MRSVSAADGARPQNITYAGNGSYAVRLVTYDTADDVYCEGRRHHAELRVNHRRLGRTDRPGVAAALPRSVRGSGRTSRSTMTSTPAPCGYLFVWAYDARFGANGAIVGDYPRGRLERGALGGLGDRQDRRPSLPTRRQGQHRRRRAGGQREVRPSARRSRSSSWDRSIGRRRPGSPAAAAGPSRDGRAGLRTRSRRQEGVGAAGQGLREVQAVREQDHLRRTAGSPSSSRSRAASTGSSTSSMARTW